MPFTPYDAATDAIARAQALVKGARSTGRVLVRDPTTGKRAARPARLSAPVRADMRRLSVVMAVAALDTYMHRLVVARVFTHERLPGGLARLEVPFEVLLEQADDTARAARRPAHNSRPRVTVKRELRDRLLRETFQTYEAVSRALGMAGRSGDWRAIAAEMPVPIEPSKIKERLNAIVTRRNQIVHEGDYERLEKPRRAKLNGMAHRHAESDIDFIAALIDAIHAVVA